MILLNALYGGQSFCGMSAVDSNNPWIDADGGRAGRGGVSNAHDNNMAIKLSISSHPSFIEGPERAPRTGVGTRTSHAARIIQRKQKGNKSWNKILLISPGAANRATSMEGAKSPFLFYCMNANPARKWSKASEGFGSQGGGGAACGHALGISAPPAPYLTRTRCHRARYLPAKNRGRIASFKGG